MVDLHNEKTAEIIFKYIEKNRPRITLNSKIFDIYEGEIGSHLKEKILQDLGEETFQAAKERIVPVNIFKKYVDKVSKIYQQSPRREVTGSTSDAQAIKDKEIVDKFVDILDWDMKMNINNELWNSFRYSLLQVGSDKEKPFIRTIPNHQFLIMSISHIDPTSDDVVILFMEPEKDVNGMEKQIYWIYTDDQFAIYDSTPKIRLDLMLELNQDGTLPYDGKPFGYLNESTNLTMPKIQNDTFDITLLIPLLLSDTTYIAKFTTFTQMYTIDVDAKKLSLSPNFIWPLQSDDETDKKPEVGTIKPEGDIDKLTNLALSLLEVWLNTKGVKTGAIGTATVEAAASGISKLIDEADTLDIREAQATMYSKFETQMWDYILKVLYPFWKEQGMIENFGEFSPNAKVVTTFAPQTPVTNRRDIVSGQKEELDAGFTTKKRAIKTINPNMGDSDIDELMVEIEDDEEVLSFGEPTEQDGNETEGSNT